MEADPRFIIMVEDVEAKVYGTMGGKSRADKGVFCKCLAKSAFAIRRSRQR